MWLDISSFLGRPLRITQISSSVPFEVLQEPGGPRRRKNVRFGVNWLAHVSPKSGSPGGHDFSRDS